MLTLADIIAARERIAGGIYTSPCVESIPLSQLTDAHIYCKLDYLQRTGSFKERGARNALLLLSDEQRRRGVVAASAGNHALGLAYHGSLLAIPVTVVMPKFAALIKVTNCRQLGARVILHGIDLTEARAHAEGLAQREGLTFVHPFDNTHVMAGQGTMALEILEQVPDLEAIVVPVGGGGLLAGVGTVFKALRPQVRVVGVEPSHAACLTAALAAGHPVTVPLSPTLADGLAVPTLGAHPFEVLQQVVDEVVTVDDACEPKQGSVAANRALNDKICFVVGPVCSGAAIAAAPIYNNEGVVVVTPSATSPALTDPNQAFKIGYLRTAHNDLIQGAAMADYAYDVRGFTKAAAIHDGDPYTEGLAKAFADAFVAKGGEMVAFEAEAADATNVEPLLTTIAAAKPEFLYFPVFIPLGSLIVNPAKTIPGRESVQLAAADGVQSPSFLENVVGTGEGMVVSGPDLAFSNTFYKDEFLPMYEADYGTAPTAPFHAHSFDATNMLLNAIEKVAQQDADGNLLIGRQALRDALYATSGMEGITGTLTCSEFGDCADPKIAVSEIQSGEFVRIWP